MLSPTASSNSTAPSTSELTPSPKSPAPSPISPVELIQHLNQQSTEIKAYLSSTEPATFSQESESKDDDPRVADVRIHINKHSPTTTKFRAGLARRSLALSFQLWEYETHGASRINELAEDLSVAKIRQNGHLEQYLDANRDQFQNRNAAQTGIVLGIKYLVFELLLGFKSISAILIFEHCRFRNIKYEELRDLKDLMNTTGWIMELVGQKESWYNQCLKRYDERCLYAPEEASRKRRRLNQSSILLHPSNTRLSQQSGNRAFPPSWGRDIGCGNSGLDILSRAAQLQVPAAAIPLPPNPQSQNTFMHPEGTAHLETPTLRQWTGATPTTHSSISTAVTTSSDQSLYVTQVSTSPPNCLHPDAMSMVSQTDSFQSMNQPGIRQGAVPRQGILKCLNQDVNFSRQSSGTANIAAIDSDMHPLPEMVHSLDNVNRISESVTHLDQDWYHEAESVTHLDRDWYHEAEGVSYLDRDWYQGSSLQPVFGLTASNPTYINPAPSFDGDNHQQTNNQFTNNQFTNDQFMMQLDFE